jgi:hypothetical protein
MSKFAQGLYQIKNLSKYVGKGQPRYRSSWEHAFMRFLDNNDHVVNWASESLSIPYRNPITGKQSMYVPDFLITYRSRTNTLIAELVEIKPKNQSVVESKMNANQRAVIAVNYAKWDAATKWARRNGLTFRVITEDDMFRNGKK